MDRVLSQSDFKEVMYSLDTLKFGCIFDSLSIRLVLSEINHA